jgi:hypothetical protein
VRTFDPQFSLGGFELIKNAFDEAPKPVIVGAKDALVFTETEYISRILAMWHCLLNPSISIQKDAPGYSKRSFQLEDETDWRRGAGLTRDVN